MNFLEQTGQEKFFSPVCVRVWRASSSDLANLFPHPPQLHGKGRSPGKRIKKVKQNYFTFYTHTYK